MNQFELLYIYIWKCHDKTPCIAILNQQKCHFFTKTEKRKTEQGYRWDGGGYKERVQEGEYGEILCIHV
jgi:hypothetical protein